MVRLHEESAEVYSFQGEDSVEGLTRPVEKVDLQTKYFCLVGDIACNRVHQPGMLPTQIMSAYLEGVEQCTTVKEGTVSWRNATCIEERSVK